MKKTFLLIIMLLFSGLAMAEYVMYVEQNNTRVRSEKCADVDSIVNAGTVSIFKNSKVYNYDQTLVSLTFEDIVSASDTVKITYGTEVVIENPYPESVMITTSGNHVSVNCVNQLKDVVYKLSGKSDDGSFVIDCPRKFYVVMDNLSLRSQQVVSPVRSFSGSTMTVVLPDGTSSELSDSSADTCNATLRSKGQIVFEGGNGALKVTANAKRAIQSGDYIEFNQGKVTAVSLLGDAVKSNDYFEMNGGELIVEGTGIEVSEGYMVVNGGVISCSSSLADGKLIKVAQDTTVEGSETNGTLTMNGGEIDLTVDGNGSKGIKTDYDIIIKGGTLKGTVSGTIYETINDVSYAAFAKANRYFNMRGGTVDIELKENALGSRGLAADSGINVGGNAVVKINADCKNYTTSGKGKVKPGYGLKSDGNITFDACTVEIVSTQSSNSAVCLNAKSDVGSAIVNFNDEAKVYLESASNVCMTDADNVNFNGGVVVGFSGNGCATGTVRIKSNGGTFVGLGKSSSSAISQGKSLVDKKYITGTSISIAGDGNVFYQSSSSVANGSLTSGCLQIFSPTLKENGNVTYKVGGTINSLDAFHGYSNSGTHQGATGEFNVTIVNATNIVDN